MKDSIFLVDSSINKLFKRILALFIVFFMILQPINVSAEDVTLDIIPDEEIHYLAFASDRHAAVVDLETGETYSDGIEKSFAGMPDTVEYVCIVGDMVGVSGDIGGTKPVSRSSDVFNEIKSVGFKGINSKGDVSILWADHDTNMVDDEGIIFADKGYGSGVMKKGLNSDGSTAYYVYGIGFYEMRDAEYAERAALKFMEWVDTLEDNTVPIIVLCHMPIHFARGDNRGAIFWNLALNYAATGNATTKSGIKVNRDVLFMHGHNHTIETDENTGDYSGEFYIPRGSKMEVGVDENDFSTIYYTYTTSGYLNANNAATLVSITDDNMTIEKYQSGAVADGFYDTESKKSKDFATRFSTDGTHVIDGVEEMTPIKEEDITGVEKTYEYTGEEICPEITLPEEYYEIDGRGRIKNYLYSVRYNNNIGPGEASVTITAMAPHFGSVTIPFTIEPKETEPEVIPPKPSETPDEKGQKKADNTLKVKGKTATVKYSRIKKKTRTLKVNKVIKFTSKGQGTLKYKLSFAKKGKKSFKKYFKINSRTGKVTIKKGVKKGTYRVRVKVSAAGNSNYNPSAVKTVTFKIKVK